MVGLLSQMEGSDHTVGSPDHSLVATEHSTDGENDAAERGDGHIAKPDSCTETDVTKTSDENQNLFNENPSNPDNTTEDQEKVKEPKSILKQRGQYTMRKVKVDFDLIPKKIPFDETKDYTVEIQIVAKEPVKIKSWAAIFAAQKAEAEAEAAAVAEAEAALKKAEEVKRRESIKKASKAKLGKKEEDNKPVAVEQKLVGNENKDESTKQQKSTINPEEAVEQKLDADQLSDRDTLSSADQESVASDHPDVQKSSDVDNQLAPSDDRQELENETQSHQVLELTDPDNVPERLDDPEQQNLTSEVIEGSQIEYNASITDNKRVEYSIVQLDGAADVSVAEDGKGSDSESSCDNVKSYDISETFSTDLSENLSADLPENLKAEIARDESSLNSSIDVERADLYERLSGLMNGDGTGSSTEDLKISDASESLSLDIPQSPSSNSVSDSVNMYRDNSDTSRNSNKNGETSVSESSKANLKSASGEKSSALTFGENSLGIRDEKKSSIIEDLSNETSLGVKSRENEKLPEEILVTAVSVVAEVLAETPVKLKSSISFDEDSKTDCTSMDTDLPDPEKLESQNDDRSELSIDLLNEDKSDSILGDLSEVSSSESKSRAIEPIEDTSNKRAEKRDTTSEMAKDTVGSKAKTLIGQNEGKLLPKSVISEEFKAKANNVVVSKMLNESLKKASTDIIQTAVRVLVDVEKVTLAVVQNLEPIAP